MPVARADDEPRLSLRREELSVLEFQLAGVAAAGDAFVAFAYSPTGQLYAYRPGDRLADGQIRSVDSTDVLIETDEGPFRIPLPPPSSKRFDRRSRRPTTKRPGSDLLPGQNGHAAQRALWCAYVSLRIRSGPLGPPYARWSHVSFHHASLRKRKAPVENASCVRDSSLPDEIASAASTSVVLADALSDAKMLLGSPAVKKKKCHRKA